MSPEQASGQHDDLDGRSDIYALGLILFELLSLRPAIRGGSLPDVIISAIEGKVEDLRPAFEREPIPPALRAITLKAIRLHPDDRYPHAEALAADIRRFLRGEPTEALPEGWAQTLSRWLFRHRFPVLVSFLSILLLAVSVALGSLVHQSRISERAFFREREISRFLTRVSLQANRVENHLLQYEILLGEIASAASLALESGHPSPDTFFDSRTFSDPSTPPDRTPHPIYKTDVSFAHPVWHRSPGLPSDDATDPIRRLLPLRPRLFRIFFPDGDLPFPLSSPPRVSADAIPLGWVTLGLENGLAMIYPGRSGLPASYDPRTRPWYRQAVTKRGTVWGAPYLDALKADTYVPCSTALRSSKRDLLGVVGLDLRLSFLRSRLLPLRSQRGLQEIALLDHEGQILSRHDPHIPRPARLPPPARTTSESRKRLDVKRVSQRRRIILREPPTTESAALAPATAEGTTLESYPSRLVLDAIRSKRSGWLETPDSPKQAATLIAFYRLEALGWYYVAVVDRKALLRPLKTP